MFLSVNSVVVHCCVNCHLSVVTFVFHSPVEHNGGARQGSRDVGLARLEQGRMISSPPLIAPPTVLSCETADDAALLPSRRPHPVNSPSVNPLRPRRAALSGACCLCGVGSAAGFAFPAFPPSSSAPLTPLSPPLMPCSSR